MKKGLIFAILLMSVLALGFSQTGNSWTVTNVSTWIEAVNGIRSGGNDKTYTITVNSTVSVPASTESTFGAVTGITVNIEGRGTLSPSNNGTVLTIGTGQTIIVKNITLRGRSDNPNSVVDNFGGTFRMEGSASITGNTRAGGVWVDGGTFVMKDSASVSGNSRSDDYNGGGVTVNNGGTFTMQDNASVSGNTVNRYGGGVAVNNGTFTMQEGCTITRNTVSTSSSFYGGHFTYYSHGGGVYIGDNGTFTMQGGTISGNTVTLHGGGVFNSGTFTMQGGTISGNTASNPSDSSGGGVNNSGTFTMQSGTISGNTASSGGGVYMSGGSATMQGGTISGNSECGVFVNRGTFTMQGSASISGNTSNGSGGGVYVNNNATFTMQGSTSISGNTSNSSGGGVYVYQNGTFAMQDSTSISGNTAIFYGGGVRNWGTFNKTGGTIYGDDADANQSNTVTSRFGHSVHGGDRGWRNGTAGPTMNPDTYGFWLNDGDLGDVAASPFVRAGYSVTYKRSNFNNTLTLTPNHIKASNSNRVWILQRVSGDSYTYKRADAANTITLTITSDWSGNLVISGDSGSGQDNWNGTWISQ